MLLIIVYQKALFNDYFRICINANGCNANSQRYSLFMQRKGFNGLKSMLIILLLTGDLLYGLMNAQLNVEQVYGQSGHGIHQLNNSKKMMSMPYELVKGLSVTRSDDSTRTKIQTIMWL